MTNCNQHIDSSCQMTGAHVVVSMLEELGVTHVFGYPGSFAIDLYDALYDSTAITPITAAHEQAAVHEADGYARVTGSVGVCMVTSGPGSTNAVTGIATAYMDSIPLVVITGQVPHALIGTDSFQESDIVGITLPVVKHSYLVQSADELAQTMADAFHIANSGRPGPVLIDIPADISSAMTSVTSAKPVSIASYKPTYRGNMRQVKQAVSLIKSSKQPIIIAGGGICASGAQDTLLAFAEALQIPVVTTLMGKGTFNPNHPLFIGGVGIHGARYAIDALNSADLVIAIGTRFSNRMTGDVESFARNAAFIHIDIDPAEIGKIVDVRVPIVGDARLVLESLLSCFGFDGDMPDTKSWVEHVVAARQSDTFIESAFADSHTSLRPEAVLSLLSDKIADMDAVVTTEVGQNQMWAAQVISSSDARRYLTSGGLGTMGFGFPAAVGAAIAMPKSCVVCIAGDGSFQMNVQEMATAFAHKLSVKVLLLRNNALGMVRQQQTHECDARYSQSDIAALPDYRLLAQAYGWSYFSLSELACADGVLDTFLQTDGPCLLEVAIDKDCEVRHRQ